MNLKRLNALEIERALVDPLSTHVRHYESSPTQEAFHQRFSITEQRPYYSLVSGGGRAGKTSACLIDLAWCMRGIHPYMPWRGPFTAIIFCKSRQQAAMVSAKKLFRACEIESIIDIRERKKNENHVPIYPLIPASPLIPLWEIAKLDAINVGFESIQHARLHNGCEVFFSWSDVAETANRIQGPKIGYVMIDENAGSQKLMIEARKRLVDSQKPGDWRGQLVWAGHGTEDNRVFDKYKEICEDPAERDHKLFLLLPGETGAVTQEAIDRFSATLTEEERKIHITGESSAGGLVRIYGKQWDDNRHMLKADYEISPEDNLWVAYDPGVDHPMGMLVGALNKRNPMQIIVVKCWLRKGGTIDDDIRALTEWLDGRQITGFVYDTNLKNKDRGGGPSVLSQFKEKMALAGVIPIQGYWQSKKNHAPGIALVRTLLVRDLIVSNPSPESGCQEFRTQMKLYKGKEETRFTGPGGVVKKDDELNDDIRYLAMQRPVWRDAYPCGRSRGSLLATIDADLPPISPEQIRQAHQQELSALAAQLRRRGHGRVRGFGQSPSVHVPLWIQRRDGASSG